MTTFISRTTSILIVIAVYLLSCSKEPFRIPPPTTVPPGDTSITPPSQPVDSGYIRFVTHTDLSGQPYHTSNLMAMVTIANEKNEEVIKDRMLSLNLNGTITSGYLKLPPGLFKLTRFQLVYGSVQTHFVTPVNGSVKASLVQKPLVINFTVQKTASADVQVEVVKVGTDRPQAFGYPAGAFDFNQEENSPYIKVKMRAIMKIGDVIYDSIPASLTISTWNDKGEMTTTYGSLAAGINEVQVQKAAVKYQFLVSKWGTNDAMTLNRQDVDENTVYTLGGSKAARKLKSEIEFKQVNGAYVADSKTAYFYNNDGNLSYIEYWKKKADNTPYVDMKDVFEYDGKKVQKISRYNETNKNLLSTIAFVYDLQGKVTSMKQVENGIETNATVTYAYFGRQEVNIHYDYPPTSNTMDYYTAFDRGNMTSANATTSNGNYENGKYNYDFNINPYRHMNWPNLFLSNSSKNNLTFQDKTFYGSYPISYPYTYSYTYDGEGYPTEVIKHHKTFQYGTYAFTTKTVFTY